MPQMNISTIDNPEFINLQPLDINPLMSECEIKVLYLGQNRNHSYITKEVATEMSKTLRGAPIVGWFKEDKEDFGDHGDRLIIDGDGLRFECLTKPYGFVAPDAQVWFQKFKESDDFGNEIIREYLMTTGFLWTGQFKECQSIIDSGRPHSMELDKESLNGKWSTDINSNIDFFIINDAIFSKLCILGEDIEPCFEGSSVTAPEVSKNFTKVDDNFKQTLFKMMEELKFALQEGGTSMVKEIKTQVEEKIVETQQENFSVTQDKIDQNSTGENQNSTEEVKTENVDTSFASSEKKKDDNEDTKEEADDKETEAKDNSEDDEEDKKKKSITKNSLNNENVEGEKYTDLEQKYNELNNKYTQLQENYQTLVDFKNQIDNEKKDALIAKFYMLSDEDKKDIIENKMKYTLDEIEAKLSIIYTKKQFALENHTENQKQDASQIVTYNLKEDEIVDSAPDWVKAVLETETKLYS